MLKLYKQGWCNLKSECDYTLWRWGYEGRMIWFGTLYISDIILPWILLAEPLPTRCRGRVEVSGDSPDTLTSPRRLDSSIPHCLSVQNTSRLIGDRVLITCTEHACVLFCSGLTRSDQIRSDISSKPTRRSKWKAITFDKMTPSQTVQKCIH